MSEVQNTGKVTGVSGDFIIRKVHSLSGFLPLVFFLAFHLVANAIALIGGDLYIHFIEAFTSIPGLIVVEILVIFIPLLIHGFYGIYLVFTGRNNPLKYGYTRNWLFFFQRITGLLIFAFLVWHLVTIKFAGLSAAGMYGVLGSSLDNPLGLVFFAASMIAVSFHVANGLFGFGINWGILPGMRAQKVFTVISMILFVVLAIFWLTVMTAFM